VERLSPISFCRLFSPARSVGTGEVLAIACLMIEQSRGKIPFNKPRPRRSHIIDPPAYAA
jgi:hypothetical protein